MSEGQGIDPRLLRPRRPEQFEALYAGTPPPWDIGRRRAHRHRRRRGQGGRARAPGPVPGRIGQDELRASFADGWRVDAIEPATIDTRGNYGAVLAWLASMTRVEAAGRMA